MALSGSHGPFKLLCVGLETFVLVTDCGGGVAVAQFCVTTLATEVVVVMVVVETVAVERVDGQTVEVAAMVTFVLLDTVVVGATGPLPLSVEHTEFK